MRYIIIPIDVIFVQEGNPSLADIDGIEDEDVRTILIYTVNFITMDDFVTVLFKPKVIPIFSPEVVPTVIATCRHKTNGSMAIMVVFTGVTNDKHRFLILNLVAFLVEIAGVLCIEMDHHYLILQHPTIRTDMIRVTIVGGTTAMMYYIHVIAYYYAIREVVILTLQSIENYPIT